MYVVLCWTRSRLGTINLLHQLLTFPKATHGQVLATFEALKRSSVLFIASWVCLSRVTLPRLIWGTQRANGGLPKPPLLRLQAMMMLCALCTLVLDMLLASRPHIQSVAWLSVWTALEAGSLAGFPRLATTMRWSKPVSDADEHQPEGADTIPHLFLRQLGASFILLLIAQVRDGMAALVRWWKCGAAISVRE